ncbi:AEC family transporter [Atopomonas sediminilitoris]|uniref:AEC family transporter n=1 Tax=Atopomonas sediminilitoris TaxID=2919919 RepID=UPI001F4E7857|nr:AEC family transporter [Atopomonas sediminilitoris]MCJ8170487.1 AEC family transporter [Atopomonas sediminilitoris]
MSGLLELLWPIMALIALGAGLKQRAWLDAGFWPAAERLNYFLLFPALLVSSLANAPLAQAAPGRLLLALAAVLLLGWLLLLGLRRWRGWTAGQFGPHTQGLIRFNTYIGLALTGGLFGEAGLAIAALLLAVLVPAVNVLSVLALLSDRPLRWRALLWPLLRNPLILACLAGLLLNLSGLGLPLGSAHLLGFLAEASLPLGLLCVGAALQWQALGTHWRALLASSLLRLLLMPALALAVALTLQLPTISVAVMVIFFALPTAPTAYVLTSQLGGDARLMAGLITLQTLLAALSLGLWLALIATRVTPAVM